MIRLFLLLGVVLFSGGCRLFTEENESPECMAYMVPSGKSVTLDAEFWQKLPKYYLCPVPGYLSRHKVEAQFAYDRDALYFRFSAEDDDLVDKFPENGKGMALLYADTMELFLRPPQSRGYWEFHFTPSGRSGSTHFPSRGRRLPENVLYLPVEGLKYTVRLDGTLNQMDDLDSGWSGLVEIPFKLLKERRMSFSFEEGLRVQVTSIAYSVYADWDERRQLNVIAGLPSSLDPHNINAWVHLKFQEPTAREIKE